MKVKIVSLFEIQIYNPFSFKGKVGLVLQNILCFVYTRHMMTPQKFVTTHLTQKSSLRAMASTIPWSSLSRAPTLLRVRNNARPVSCKAHAPKSAQALHASRRNLLFFSLTALPVLTARESASSAEDIPLFGLRRKLKQAEEEAVDIVREVEKKIETVEERIEASEKEVETTVGFGGLAQAGAVAGAELVGLLVATSVVNGILGPEPQ